MVVRRIIKIVILFILISLVAYNLFVSYIAMMKTVESIAQSHMEEVANKAIHNAILTASANSSVYSDLITIEKGDDGSIRSLSLNPRAANQFKSEISIAVLDYLDGENRYVINVPIGNFFGSEFFAGMGPTVKLRIIPFDIVNIDFESKFTPAGINQVLHRVEVKVDIKIGAILSGYEGISDVSSSAVVSETVIIGDVPDTYLNIKK